METYTTNQAAEKTGIPAGTIRSWMSRCPGLFKQNIHFIVEETGRKLWTEAGIEFLKTRPANKPAEESTNDTEPDLSDVLEPLLETASKQLARQFWRELPKRTLQRIQQQRISPTPEEKEMIQQSAREALSIGTFEILPSYIRGLPNGED